MWEADGETNKAIIVAFSKLAKAPYHILHLFIVYCSQNRQRFLLYAPLSDRFL